MSSKKPDNDKVQLAILTTSGRWPDAGFESIPPHQKVKVALTRAAEDLELASTDGWFVKVGGREIAPGLSYLANELTGTVTMDYGPRHGGGGSA